jgi:hypothetical protein
VTLRIGDKVRTRRHRGEIVITRVSAAGTVGRKVLRSGKGLEDREVVVYLEDVAALWPRLF